MRPLTSLFALRTDCSVDSVLQEVRVAGWHEVTRGRGDRLVIGPGGLIVIAERMGAGRIRDEWADEVRTHAQGLERMTNRTVDALVVLTRQVAWTDPRPFRGATLLPIAALAAHLTARPRVLAPSDIDALRTRLRQALAV